MVQGSFPESSDIIVSVVIATYNHEKYIQQAIEGVLKQKTNFRIEILINDDFSTDNTTSLIRAHEVNYPNLFVVFYQKENLYSKGVKPWFDILFPASRGKYIALCEGDDYWTDPYKLQKQVDFLEANEDFVITYHDATVIDETGNILQDSQLDIRHKRDASEEDLICVKVWIKTLTACFRNVVKEMPKEAGLVMNGDTFLFSLLGNYGKGKWMDNIAPAAYRIHAGGVWSHKSEDKRVIQYITTYYWLMNFYLRINKIEYAKYWLNYAIFRITNFAAQNKILASNPLDIISELETELRTIQIEKINKLETELCTIQNSRAYRFSKKLSSLINLFLSPFRKLKKWLLRRTEPAFVK